MLRAYQVWSEELLTRMCESITGIKGVIPGQSDVNLPRNADFQILSEELLIRV